MTVGAIVDEGGFKAGFDTGDAALVDVGLFLDAVAVFDVEVVKTLAIDQSYPQFFFLRGIDENAFHVVFSVL